MINMKIEGNEKEFIDYLNYLKEEYPKLNVILKDKFYGECFTRALIEAINRGNDKRENNIYFSARTTDDMRDNAVNYFKKLICMGTIPNNLDNTITFALTPRNKDVLELTLEMLENCPNVKLRLDISKDISMEELKDILGDAKVKIEVLLSNSGLDFERESVYKKNIGPSSTSILEFEKTSKYVDDILKDIPQEFSPLEKYIYIRRMVCNFKPFAVDRDMYGDVLAGTNSNPYVMLLNNNISCYGYANLAEMFIEKINDPDLKCVTVRDDEKDHGRNVVFIDDKKYGVSGIYFDDLFLDRIKMPNKEHAEILPENYRACLLAGSDFKGKLGEFAPSNSSYQAFLMVNNLKEFGKKAYDNFTFFLGFTDEIISKLNPGLYDLEKSRFGLDKFSSTRACNYFFKEKDKYEELIDIIGSYTVVNLNGKCDRDILKQARDVVEEHIAGQYSDNESSSKDLGFRKVKRLVPNRVGKQN